MASDADNTAMFDLVFKHQQPRMMTYLSWLKEAFRPTEAVASHLSNQRLWAMLHAQPLSRHKAWTDQNGLEFDIPINAHAPAAKSMESFRTGESFKAVHLEVSHLLITIQSLCIETRQTLQDEWLRQLMCTTFELWRGFYTRSIMKKTYLPKPWCGPKATR